MEIDLRTGSVSGTETGVAWVSNLVNPSSASCVCDHQGVLKLTFAPGSRERLEVNMTFEYADGWTFNLGDSSTNNGWGECKCVSVSWGCGLWAGGEETIG
jgi:hypothetical protein